jgi:hypothetical protein
MRPITIANSSARERETLLNLVSVVFTDIIKWSSQVRFGASVSTLIIGLAVSASAALAGSAAPAPLAGAGLLPFAAGGACAVAWIAARAFGKRLKERKPRN